MEGRKKPRDSIVLAACRIKKVREVRRVRRERRRVVVVLEEVLGESGRRPRMK
jgi:hypothetical protein